MTSPAQLKYLDAMGIPVWVSRDLIIEESILLEPVSVTSRGEVSTGKQPSALSGVQSNHSAQSILDSLEASSVRPSVETTTQNQNKETKILLDDVVTDSVSRAKLTDDFTASSAPTEIQLNQNLLFQSSQHYVYASGSKTAQWMVIGHSPEPFNGIGQEPFAGEAGELLNNMLRAVGIEQPRTQAYLLNVVDGTQSIDTNEAVQQKLNQDLLSVISEVKPKILLFVGQIAAQNLLDSSDPLIIMRSKVHKLKGSDIPCVVTYYPSYLLQKPADKRKAWDDLKLAMSQLG